MSNPVEMQGKFGKMNKYAFVPPAKRDCTKLQKRVYYMKLVYPGKRAEL